MMAETSPPAQQQQLRGASNMLQEQQTEAGTQQQISQSTAQPAKPSLKAKGSGMARDFLSGLKSKSSQRGTAGGSGAAPAKTGRRVSLLPFVPNPPVSSTSNPQSSGAAGFSGPTGSFSPSTGTGLQNGSDLPPSRVAPAAAPGIMTSSHENSDVLALRPGPISGPPASGELPVANGLSAAAPAMPGTTLVTTTTTEVIEPRAEPLESVPLAGTLPSRPRRPYSWTFSVPPARAPVPMAANKRPYAFIDVESIEVRLSAGQARTRRAPGNLPQVGTGRYTHLDPARPMTQRYKFIDPLADEIRSTNKTIVTSQEDLLYPSLYNIDRFRPGYLLERVRADAPAMNGAAVAGMEADEQYGVRFPYGVDRTPVPLDSEGALAGPQGNAGIALNDIGRPIPGGHPGSSETRGGAPVPAPHMEPSSYSQGRPVPSAVPGIQGPGEYSRPLMSPIGGSTQSGVMTEADQPWSERGDLAELDRRAQAIMDSYKMYDNITPDVVTQLEQGEAAFNNANRRPADTPVGSAGPSSVADGAPTTPTRTMQRPTEGVASQPTPSSDSYMENPMFDEAMQEDEDYSSSTMKLPQRDNTLTSPPRKGMTEGMPGDATRQLPGHEAASSTHTQSIPENREVGGAGSSLGPDGVPTNKASMAEEANVPIILLEPGVEQEMDALASRRQGGYHPQRGGPQWVEQDVSGYSAQVGYEQMPPTQATGPAPGAYLPHTIEGDMRGYTSALQGPYLPATAHVAGISPGPAAPSGAPLEMLPGTPTLEERLAEMRRKEEEKRQSLLQQQQVGAPGGAPTQSRFGAPTQQAAVAPPTVGTTQTVTTVPQPTQTFTSVQQATPTVGTPSVGMVPAVAGHAVGAPSPGRLGEAAPLEVPTPFEVPTPLQVASPTPMQATQEQVFQSQGPFAVEQAPALPIISSPVVSNPQAPVYQVGQRFEGPIDGPAQIDDTADVELKMMMQRSRQLSTQLPQEETVNPHELRSMMQRSRDLSPPRSPVGAVQQAAPLQAAPLETQVGAPVSGPTPGTLESHAPHDMSSMFAASRVLSTGGSEVTPMDQEVQHRGEEFDLATMLNASRSLSQEVPRAPQATQASGMQAIGSLQPGPINSAPAQQAPAPYMAAPQFGSLEASPGASALPLPPQAAPVSQLSPGPIQGVSQSAVQPMPQAAPQAVGKWASPTANPMGTHVPATLSSRPQTPVVQAVPAPVTHHTEPSNVWAAAAAEETSPGKVGTTSDSISSPGTPPLAVADRPAPTSQVVSSQPSFQTNGQGVPVGPADVAHKPTMGERMGKLLTLGSQPVTSDQPAAQSAQPTTHTTTGSKIGKLLLVGAAPLASQDTRSSTSSLPPPQPSESPKVNTSRRSGFAGLKNLLSSSSRKSASGSASSQTASQTATGTIPSTTSLPATGVTGPAPVLSSGTGLAHPVVGELHAGRIGEADPTPLPPQGVPTQATHVEPARLRAPIKHEPMRDLPPGEPIAPYKPATVVTKDFVEPAGGLPSLGVMNSAPVAQSGVTSQPQVGAMDQGMQQPLSTPVEPLQAPAPTSSTSAGESTGPSPGWFPLGKANTPPQLTPQQPAPLTSIPSAPTSTATPFSAPSPTVAAPTSTPLGSGANFGAGPSTAAGTLSSGAGPSSAGAGPSSSTTTMPVKGSGLVGAPTPGPLPRLSTVSLREDEKKKGGFKRLSGMFSRGSKKDKSKKSVAPSSVTSSSSRPRPVSRNVSAPIAPSLGSSAGPRLDQTRSAAPPPTAAAPTAAATSSPPTPPVQPTPSPVQASSGVHPQGPFGSIETGPAPVQAAPVAPVPVQTQPEPQQMAPTQNLPTGVPPVPVAMPGSVVPGRIPLGESTDAPLQGLTQTGASGMTGGGMSSTGTAFAPTIRSGGINSSVESLGTGGPSPAGMSRYGSEASTNPEGAFHTPKGSFDGSLDELNFGQQQAMLRQAV